MGDGQRQRTVLEDEGERHMKMLTSDPMTEPAKPACNGLGPTVMSKKKVALITGVTGQHGACLSGKGRT